MKPWIIFILLAICFASQSFLCFSRTMVLYPVFDSQGLDTPRNLRTAQQGRIGKPSLNFEGLKYLRVSGSGQFSEKHFNEMLQHLPISPQQLIVLDLRQESHGFINGNPVSWTDGNYNYGNLNKSKPEIEIDEYQRLRLAAQAKRIVVNPTQEPVKLVVNTVKTERVLVEEKGASYIRLPVTDHNRPSNEVLDHFIELVKSLPSDYWIHFHCKGGKGRTTTFLTLFDIMKNARQVSLNDILKRQQFIGGVDLNQFEMKEGEKKRAAQQRLELVEQFYLYCRQVPDFQMSWSTWIEQQQSAFVNNP